MNNSVVGLDIAKNIFHLYSLEADGKATKKKLKRAELLRFFANYPVSLIGIEACGGSHYWARELTKLGHEVVLLNARYVKGFVVGNKTDFNDAQAIYEAVLRPNKRVVRAKTQEQQDMQMLHNIRQELVDKRTALVNQLRGLLMERGIVIPKGINYVRKELPFILEDAENGLTALSRELFAEQYETLKALDKAIKAQDQRIGRLCQQNANSRVGWVAAFWQPNTTPNHRQYHNLSLPRFCWVGLSPTQPTNPHGLHCCFLATQQNPEPPPISQSYITAFLLGWLIANPTYTNPVIHARHHRA